MKPRVKPRKGWRFRVIVCDNRGHYAYKDLTKSGPIDECAGKLRRQILRARGEWPR